MRSSSSPRIVRAGAAPSRRTHANSCAHTGDAISNLKVLANLRAKYARRPSCAGGGADTAAARREPEPNRPRRDAAPKKAKKAEPAREMRQAEAQDDRSSTRQRVTALPNAFTNVGYVSGPSPVPAVSAPAAAVVAAGADVAPHR